MSGFVACGEAPLAALDAVLEEYRHAPSGTRHVHLASADPCNAFAIVLRTPPEDDTGVTHVLEHLTLSGSRGFPQRDAFFRVLRHSLAASMNARSGTDSTSYHFASASRRDFANLLQFYLDAVFFPRLDELDFAREAHRLEFEVPDDPTTPLVRRGVVWNEMRGALASPAERLRLALRAALLPGGCYRFNPGGEPAALTTLDAARLRDYHRRHYCPANALFLSWGDIPAVRHHELMERHALHELAPGAPVALPESGPPAVPRRLELAASAVQGEGASVAVGWALGTASPRPDLLARLLQRVLIGDDDAPLRVAMAVFAPRATPAPACGADTATRPPLFSVGLQGLAPARAEALESCLLEALDRLAGRALPSARVVAALDALALEQARAPGRGPFGLALLLRALPQLMHGACPAEAFDVTGALTAMRRELGDGAALARLLRSELLDSPRRVTVTLLFEDDSARRADEAERSWLLRLAANLDEPARSRLLERARRLAAVEESAAEPALPRLGRADVPPPATTPEPATDTRAGTRVALLVAPPRDVVQLLLAVDAAPAGAADLALLCALLPGLGCGERAPREQQRRQASLGGAPGARLLLRCAPDDRERVLAWSVLEGSALARHRGELAALLVETLGRARLDDRERVQALLARHRAALAARVPAEGHRLALQAAAAAASPAAALAGSGAGLAALPALERLSTEPGAVAALLERLAALRDGLLRAPRALIAVGDLGARDAAWLNAPLDALPPPAHRATDGATFVACDGAGASRGFSWPGATAFVARAWPAPPPAHADAAPLAVAGTLMTDGFLHAAVRERGGAYGAGARYDGDTASFGLFSYRDPRVAGTLADFEAAVEWLPHALGNADAVERAVLRTAATDTAGAAPQALAVAQFLDRLAGRDREHRRRWREALLAVGADAVAAAARRWLRPAAAATFAVADRRLLRAAGLAEVEQLR